MTASDGSATRAGEPAPGSGAPGAGGLDDLAAQLSALARSLQEGEDLQATLDSIVGAAVGTVPGAQHASISSIRRRKEVITRASTNDLPRAMDKAQYETEQGPCLDTLFEQRTAVIRDLDSEQRWPRFTERIRDLGLGSVLSVQLYVNGEDGDLGALNLTSADKDAFDEGSERIALLFAAHAAVAMADAQQQHQLRAAVDTRDLIGQAKGILMERFKITGDQAFLLLTRASQNTNRKLHRVADDLVHSGHLPTP